MDFICCSCSILFSLICVFPLTKQTKNNKPNTAPAIIPPTCLGVYSETHGLFSTGTSIISATKKELIAPYFRSTVNRI